MKLPVPGFVSNALSSLINNNRRVAKEKFVNKSRWHLEKTQYNFPELSEEDRKEIVREILRKNKWREFVVRVAIALFIAIMATVLLFLVFLNE